MMPRLNSFRLLAVAVGLGWAALAAVAIAAPPERTALSGPIQAVVERVIDGDTVRVRARIWLGQELVTGVRLRGIDAPELHGRCAAERELALLAKAWLEAELAGRNVLLTDISGDKYGGRVVARLATTEGGDVAGSLLSRGFARPYGGQRKGRWCES